MRASSTWLTFLVLLAFGTGCWDAKKKSTVDTGEFASFFVNSASGESTETKPIPGNWEAPGTKTYQFRACLNDQATKSAVRQQRFVVEDGTYLYDTVSGNDSCIEWTEQPLNFNYYAKSYYLVFERKIRAAKTSPHKGVRTVRFLVNPWAPYRKVKQPINEVKFWPNGSPAPVNNEASIVSGKSAISAALNGHGNPLEDQARLVVLNPILDVTKKADILVLEKSPDEKELVEEKTGYQLDAMLKMKPVIRVKNVNGETKDLEVKHGRFKVFYEVVATDLGNSSKNNSLLMTNDKAEVLTKNIPPIVSPILSDGFIDAKTSFAVSKRVTDGKLKLAIRVLPLEAPGGIEPFDGLYSMGNHNRFTNASSLRLERESNFHQFNFLQFIQSTADFEDLKKSYLAFDNRPFDFSIATGTYETIAPGETATQRTVLFRTTTCVFDNALLGERVKFRQFVVYRDGKRIPDGDAQTDEEGCLNFMGEVSHGFYKPERLIQVNFKIFSSDTNIESGVPIVHKGKKLFDLSVKVNPWDDKFTFFRDTRYLSAELASNLEREKIESRFFVHNFSYQTLRFGYDIDEYMNLTVKKTVLLQIEPWVLRYNGIVAGRNNKQPIRDGIYLMKVAFQKDYLDPATKGVLIRKRTAKETSLNNEPGVKERKSEQTVSHWDPEKGKYVDLDKDSSDRKKKQYVSIVKKLVRVNNGKIITPLELSLRDLRLLRVRSQFLIQLEPIDERLLLVANKFDLHATREVTSKVHERYDAMLQKIADERGEKEKEEFIEYMRFHSSSLSAIDKFRALSDEEEDIVIQEIDKKQKELLAVIKELQKKYEDEQKEEEERGEEAVRRNIDDPKKLREILSFRNLYDENFEKALAVNDFTLMQAAPVIEDLNYLVEPPEISGLKARTFIGPLTFILNSNSSHVRPTDNLDEAWCPRADDCDSMKYWGLTVNRLFSKDLQGQYRNSKYYSSVAHLSHVHVEHPDKNVADRFTLMDDYKNLQKKYKQEMEARSNIGNFVSLYGYKFVSFRDEDLLQVKTACNTIYREDFKESCYEKNEKDSMPADEFFKQINEDNDGTKITKDIVREVIRTGQMSPNVAQQFCDLFLHQLYPDHKSDGYITSSLFSRRKELYKVCDEASRNSQDKMPFVVDRRLRLYKMGKNYVFNGGKQMNINVASNISLSRDEKFSYGLGLSGTGSKKPGSFLDDLSGVLRVSFDYNRSKGSGESTVINEQTFLVMQTASFDIELTEYERCAAIKWNPDIFSEYDTEIVEALFSDRGVAKETPGGIFVCSGIKESEPLYVREKYYYFIQFFTDGDMLDSGDLYNHPWLLALRGERDASLFLSSLHKNNFVLTALGDSLTKGPGWPIRKMVETYLKVLPTFTKMYTVLDRYGPDYPRNILPEQTFEGLDPTSMSTESIMSLNMDEASEELLGLPGYNQKKKVSDDDKLNIMKGIELLKQWLPGNLDSE